MSVYTDSINDGPCLATSDRGVHIADASKHQVQLYRLLVKPIC